MPSETGVWNQREANECHLFSYRLAQWIGKTLRNNKNLPIRDFGCGLGTYCQYLTDIGFKNVYGFDGIAPVNADYNVIECDLSQPLQMEKFCLAQRLNGHHISLEIGEHIPEQYENQFIENITSGVIKGGFLIMSWAVRGQDGIGHVNCKDNHEVIPIIEQRGFKYESELTEQARAVVEGHVAYFKQTILIFSKL